jgi:hypothetical protein
MKKLVMLAVILAPAFGIAQDKKAAPTAVSAKEVVKDKEAEKGSKLNLQNPESLFAELVISETNNGVLMRADVGRETAGELQDKELVEALSTLRSIQFYNVPDAMVHFNSIGFHYVNSYLVHRGDKVDTHLIFEKKLTNKHEGAVKPNVSTGNGRNEDSRQPGKTPQPQVKEKESKGEKK